MVWSNEHTWAESRQIRLICIDRPRYGYSTLKAGKGMLDFIRDVEYLLDFLGVESFEVHRVSGGGPFALACA